MTPVLVSVLAVTATTLAFDASPRRRPPRPHSPRRPRPTSGRPGAATASVLVALGSFLLVGGIGGAVMGVALAVVVLVVVPRMETIHARRRRDRLSAQSPLAIDLVTACLASGAGVESALAAAARAVGEPLAGVLDAATTALALGADPVAVWRDVGTVDSLSSLARALARSADTGAGLAALLPRVAEEARATQRARIEERVRTASVRLTAPLGLAFLPAFVLLGVVPVVASWVGVLL